jgi:hypothetical protein
VANLSFDRGRALLIGVGVDLPVTVQDAIALKSVLVDPGRAAYPENQVKLLVEAQATRAAILGALDDLVAHVNEESTVLVYYSGHGGQRLAPNLPPQYFLMPYGYDPLQLEKTAVSGAEFTARIEALRTRKLVVFLDCCHAAGVPAVKAEEEQFEKAAVPPELLTALEYGSGRIVAASSHSHEFSYIGERYSIFTSCLLEALAGKGAHSPDGFARILDVLAYLFREVPLRAKQGPQHPFVNSIRDLADNFALCYYAGGGKNVPGMPPLGPPDSRYSALELEGLNAAIEVLTRKLNLLHEAHAVENDAAQRFKLEHQIMEARAERAGLLALVEELRKPVP